MSAAARGRPMTKPRFGVDDPPLGAGEEDGDEDVDDELVAAAPVAEEPEKVDSIPTRAEAVLNDVDEVPEADAELSLVVAETVRTGTSLYVILPLIKAICPSGYAGSDATSGKSLEPVMAVPALLSQGQLSGSVFDGLSACWPVPVQQTHVDWSSQGLAIP